VTEKYFADHGMAGRIVHTQKPLCFNSVAEMNASGISFEYYGGDEGADRSQSILAVPMILHGQIVGMISAQSYKENAYTHDDKYLLELLASHAAIAIENSRLFTTIQALADADPLTNTLTRRKYFELAEREFNRARRYSQNLSVIMLDVDEFKKFNDRFGHQVGDLVLKLVTAQCKSSLREQDILGRLGGEEFAVALPDTSLEQAVQVATRLCKLVEDANLEEAGHLFEMETGETFDKSELKVTVSVGVAACDETCKNIDGLMDHADRAMYSVKHTGRNRISIWKNGEQ
jgi:two-component system cell cycle response regulator